LFARANREHCPKKDLGLSKGIDSVKVLFMSEPLTVTYERVDDLPLLLAQLKRMGIQQLLARHFPTHGNWQGLTLGWVASIWLGHILWRADHRLSYVQPWAEKRLSTLSICTGQSVRTLDLSDDRLEYGGVKIVTNSRVRKPKQL
jgi:hypothetical protein